jgi:hypothetical protein
MCEQRAADSGTYDHHVSLCRTPKSPPQYLRHAETSPDGFAVAQIQLSG